MNDTVMKRAIIYAWVVLFVSLILNLLGILDFTINVENERFIMVCEFIDSHMWLKMVVACIINLFSSYFVLATLNDEKLLTKKQCLIYIPLLILKSIICWYNSIIAFIIDLVILLVITTIFNRKINRNIICVLILIALQVLLMLIRNLLFGNFDDNNALISIIMQIDYVIMVFLMYSYNLLIKYKKEERRSN